MTESNHTDILGFEKAIRPNLPSDPTLKIYGDKPNSNFRIDQIPGATLVVKPWSRGKLRRHTRGSVQDPGDRELVGTEDTHRIL